MSPRVSPSVTGVSTALSSLMTKTASRPSRVVTAAAGTARRGVVSAGVSARERKATLALISGSTRGSRASKRTLTSTVALVRSAVGTIMCTLPGKRSLGMASSMISQGSPTTTWRRLDSETSTSTASDPMSAMLTTAALDVEEAPSGEMMSPTSAFLVSTTASKGASRSV